jgi:prepilin-type N-terminal cleavage/methylation domain-containing protein
MRASRPRHREAGFTLPELLLSIVILGVIAGPIAASMIVGLRSTDASAQRVGEANGAQLLSTWFEPDTLNADTVTVDDVDCSTASPAGMNLVLGRSGSDADGFDQEIDVSYRVQGTDLIRRVATCTATDPDPTEVVTERAVVHGLAASSPVSLTFTCGAVACASGSESDFTRIAIDVAMASGVHFVLHTTGR